VAQFITLDIFIDLKRRIPGKCRKIKLAEHLVFAKVVDVRQTSVFSVEEF
jgi:hypothetical protein